MLCPAIPSANRKIVCGSKAFGAGDYRAGWYLLDDDAIELDDPRGWEPLTTTEPGLQMSMSG